jgi:2-polyprenyl-3-methyl-5-hydroxy-6-metoxy-1,4-benzoquinol methylase
MKIRLPGIFKRRKRREDDDPRVRVTRDISPPDFVLVNDQSYMYREKVLPQASTVEFWEGSGLVNFLANSPFLRSEILDVGCGSGEIDIILAGKGLTVTGIDISPYAINMAQALAEKYPNCRDRVRFVAGDMESISFERRFSSAIISHTFEHVINPDRVMENVIRFLEPGSHILVAVPNKKAWRDRTHLRYYTERSMKKFLSRYSDSPIVDVDNHERMIFASAKIRS